MKAARYTRHKAKDKIIAALEVTMKRRMNGIAGIVDADYWLITEADELSTENLLYDDCCPDMESVLLNSPTLKKVLRNNLYNYGVEQVHELAEKVTKEAQRFAMQFGYFRLLNHLKDYGLRCNAICFEDVINSDSLELDHELIASRLTGGKPGLTGEDLLQQIDKLREQYPPDNPQLCRGKDIVAILAHLLPKRFKAEFGEDLPGDTKAALKKQGAVHSFALCLRF